MSKKLAAEFIGTFVLIFIGAGSIMTGKSDLLGVALAHGLAIAIMIAAVGAFSGGHFNPAVTFGFAITKRISVSDAIQYIAAQLVGAAVAAGVLKYFYGAMAGSIGGAAVAQGITPTKAMVAEALGTFLLMFVIFGVAVDKRGQFAAGFPIGLTISMIILAIGPATGAALNPARWFGPALLASTWSNAWVWIIGPMLGAALAALSYSAIFKPQK
jgi:MIP family channel proteins